MKKLTLSAGALLAAGIFMTSCSEEQSVVAPLGEATITLNVDVNNNVANDTAYNVNTGNTDLTVWETLPSTTIQIEVDGEDMQNSTKEYQGNYNYDNYTTTATIENGQVTFTVPADVDGVAVEVNFPDLQLEKTILEQGASYAGKDTLITKTETYELATQSMNVSAGDVVVENLKYTVK
jgi:hypothetical protein